MSDLALDATGPGSGVSGLGSGDATPALRVQHVSHTYPAPRRSRRSRGRSSGGGGGGTGGATATALRPALDDVSFQIERGEMFGILGPNGGGKTTLFRILCTMLPWARGSVEIFGDDVRLQPARVRTHLGVVFQQPSLDVKLTAEENLRHQGHLYGLRGRDLTERIDRGLERMNLADRRGEFVERFSGGMRRRVELAKALLHEPKLLLLDEPATGLDPGARRDVWRQLQTLRAERGVTVVLTTHLLDEADRCDRLAVLCQGKLVALDTPARLKAMIGGDVITIHPAGDPEKLRDVIARRYGPWRQGAEPAVVDGAIRLEKEQGPAFVATISAALGDQVRSITVGQPTLEDVFLHLTGHALWHEEAEK